MKYACLSLLCLLPALAQPPASEGRNLITVPVYSQADDEKVLKMFDGLRVADVSDGMDVAGLPDVGLIDPDIKPLWRDVENFKHRFIGIAVTVRYVPTNRAVPKLTEAEFPKWEGNWYNRLSSEPFVPLLRKGSVVVIDAHEDGDTGTIGSNNILLWKDKGSVGVVTSGGVRDTDEVIKEQIPMYSKRIARGIRPGRNEVESVNRPITVGGVLVRPGDIIVADGDGVICVPREQAELVARAAKGVLESDKAGRLKLYEKLGIPLDSTVK